MTDGEFAGKVDDPAALVDALDGLRKLLTDAGWEDLLDELPAQTDLEPVRVAFVGPHNAGKSSLIAALTRDLSIKRSAKPETAEATRYHWRPDVDLVDLPGWFSGFAAHDESAEEDLRRHADLVVFVMTVELGDELVVDALEHVLGDLGFAKRALVVVNKSQTEDSDSAIIRKEIERRLGAFVEIPLIATDAQSFIDTISDEFDLDEESIEVLAEGSGIPDFVAALDAWTTRHRGAARVQARALQAARVADEATARLIPTDEEEIAAASLDEFDAMVQRAKKRLESLVDSHLTKYESGIEGIADLVLKPGGLSEADHDLAWSEAGASVEALSEAADQLLEELAEDVSLVVSRMTYTASGAPSPTAPRASTTPGSPKPLAARMLGAMGVDLKGASDLIAKAGEKVARDGSGQGSVAYEMTRQLRPRKKYRPHGRLNDAKKIHKGARVAAQASVALPVVEEAWKWFQEQRASQKAAKEVAGIRSHYATLAHSERGRVEAEFADWTTKNLAPFEQKLASGRAPLADVAAERDVIGERLRSLRDGALGAGDQASQSSQS